jgi:hypothetical protein
MLKELEEQYTTLVASTQVRRQRHFLHENDDFAKAGSGQTDKEMLKKAPFSCSSSQTNKQQ